MVILSLTKSKKHFTLVPVHQQIVQGVAPDVINHLSSIAKYVEAIVKLTFVRVAEIAK